MGKVFLFLLIYLVINILSELIGIEQSLAIFCSISIVEVYFLRIRNKLK